jgi:hypothetical protein
LRKDSPFTLKDAGDLGDDQRSHPRRHALECLLTRLTNIRLLTDHDPHIHGQPFRSPTALPVTFGSK